MNDKNSLYLASMCTAASLALIWKWRQSKAKLSCPPGPRGLPLLGNTLDIPKGVPVWQTYTSMARNHDTDVLYLKLFTADLVVLSSPKAISDIFDKRSNIYSDRPHNTMFDLMGLYSWAVAFMEYGGQWRSGRKLIHEFLSIRAIPKFQDYQRKHAYRLLMRLAESPNDFYNHAEFAVGALIMDITYSLNIKTAEDKFLRAVVEATKAVRTAVIPGAFLVDTFPILRYLPEWFPGAGFKTFTRVARGKFDMAIDGPLAYVKESMFDGSENPSIAWSCFERAAQSANREHDEEVIRAATGTMYVAAVSNTTAILRYLFLVMALYPSVAKKAQAELDSVVGDGRLPDFSDQADLPYISAIVKELLRWGCPSPIEVPKRVTEDDIYNGYLIPAGATVVENTWAMFYDESTYPSPYTYDPERYLKDGKLDLTVKDPEDRIFGSGRRGCPGKHFAIQTLFLNIASILTLFDIEAPTDEKLKAKFSEDGFTRHPVPFKCTIKPRSEASLKLAQSLRDAADL